MISGRWSRIWIYVIPMLVLAAVAPFWGKPLHIDEESYQFIGHAIQADWLHPYHWWRAWQPDFAAGPTSFIYAHPPLFLWITSALQRLCGNDAILLERAAMLPFCLLLVLSYFGLARRLVNRPGLATVTFLFTPAVLLVLHQSLMIDLPFIALSLAGVLALYEAEASRRPRLQWVAGIVLGLATLTKYPALALVPLAMVPLGPVSRWPWHRGAWPVALGLAGVVVPWELWTFHVYGSPHLPYVLAHAGLIARSPLISRAVGGLAQVGWSIFAPPLALLALFPRRGRLVRLGVALMLAGGLLLVLLPQTSPAAAARFGNGLLTGLGDDLQGEVPAAPVLLIQLTAAFFLGVLGLSAFRIQRGPDRFLTLWALLTLAAALLTHNFSGARYLAPAAAPLQLLLWRRLERDERVIKETLAWTAATLGALVSIGVSVADYQLAQVYPVLGREVEALVSREGAATSRVWFSGEWGFRWEMERRGYRYLPPGIRLSRNDLVVTPRVACPGNLKGLEQATLIYEGKFGESVLKTIAPGAGIGYYSEVFGLLPYGPLDGPLEVVQVWRIP